ncbi:dihydrofolate reductase family protein [Dankookia sp. P2]|uniref:dihydrofolate reductase family protein n=1 Tax=Dankookia sp. P2 TaxID=3423955 RepID=UPI003D67DF25
MVVLTTRSLDDPPPTGLEARAGDISEIAAELEAQGYCRIWIEGGGRVVQSQVAIGKLDVHELAMISVILGKGILLFQYAGAS